MGNINYILIEVAAKLLWFGIIYGSYMFSKYYISFLSEKGSNDIRYMIVAVIIWVPIACFSAAAILSDAHLKKFFIYLLTIAIPSIVGTIIGIVQDKRKYKLIRQEQKKEDFLFKEESKRKQQEAQKNREIYGVYMDYLDKIGVPEIEKISKGGTAPDKVYFYGKWLFQNHPYKFKTDFEKWKFNHGDSIPLQSLKILSLNDHPIFAKGVGNCILKKFHSSQIKYFTDGDQALLYILDNLYSEECPDLIITDLMHPGLDGIAFSELVREKESKKSRKIPILFIDIHGDKSIINRALSIPSTKYLTSESSCETICLAVDSLLN